MLNRTGETELGFEIVENHTVMSGYVVRWQRGHIEVSASRDGVMIQGSTAALDGEGVERFLSIVERANETASFLARCYGRPERTDGVTWRYVDSPPYLARKAKEQPIG
jgi:hypothetical protein